eukprot:888894_1
MALLAQSKTKGNWVKNKPIPYVINYNAECEESKHLKNTRKIFDNHHCIVLKLNTKNKLNPDKKTVLEPGQSENVIHQEDAKQQNNDPKDDNKDDEKIATPGNIDNEHLKINQTPEGVPENKLISTSELLFYQYVSKTLTQLRCKPKAKAKFLGKAYLHIVSNIINKINSIKHNKKNVIGRQL